MRFTGLRLQAGLAEAVRSGLDQPVQLAVDNAPSTAQAAVGNVVQRRPAVQQEARLGLDLALEL